MSLFLRSVSIFFSQVDTAFDRIVAAAEQRREALKGSIASELDRLQAESTQALAAVHQPRKAATGLCEEAKALLSGSEQVLLERVGALDRQFEVGT